MKNNQQGFTLIELIVVMAVFIVVIMITGDAFKTVLSQTSKIFRSEESNIEGVVGLEMLRHDLQQVGFGLYTENFSAGYVGEASVVPASTYNETSMTVPPRAIVTGNNIPAGTQDTASESGNDYTLSLLSDYIAIKATSASRNAAAQKWTYLNFAAGSVSPNIWPSASENLASGSDKVVLLKRTLSATANKVSLIPDPSGSGSNSFYFSYSDVAFHNYSSNVSSYVLYGLDGGSTLRMPFNRSDYFVARPSTATKMPSVCATNTGELYKTVVNQSNGKLTYYPVLDCVADMQVVLGWDLRNGSAVGTDGLIDTWSNADGTAVTSSNTTGTASTTDVQAALADPAQIRTNLKMIKVYVLAQNGRKDPGYIFKNPSAVVDGVTNDQIVVGDSGEKSLTRVYDIAAAGWSNYRWKLYRVVVRPKNLQSNQ
jgi:prepilin-type N-terminal cleavage/methylation domain-containing protein